MFNDLLFSVGRARILGAGDRGQRVPQKKHLGGFFSEKKHKALWSRFRFAGFRFFFFFFFFFLAPTPPFPPALIFFCRELALGKPPKWRDMCTRSRLRRLARIVKIGATTHDPRRSPRGRKLGGHVEATVCRTSSCTVRERSARCTRSSARGASFFALVSQKGVVFTLFFLGWM